MGLTLKDIILKAREDLKKLTGLEPSSTTKTTREDDRWRVLVEMVEKRSIPDSMDILATYEVCLDDAGNILEFHRKGMRKRMDTTLTEA